MAMAEPAEKLYRVEYAKSGRASCKHCRENIAKESLRLAIMVQVPQGKGGGGVPRDLAAKGGHGACLLAVAGPRRRRRRLLLRVVSSTQEKQASKQQ